MDFSSLNDAQRRAAPYEGKHLLVLAGAGTGKTRVIIARALWLLEQGYSPESIRILSYTKKSAGEIVDRIKIEARNLPAAKELHGSTFHSWCMELIGKYSKEFCLENFVGINADDRLRAINSVKDTFDKSSIELPQGVFLSVYTINDILSYKTNTLCSIQDAARAKLNKEEQQGHGFDVIEQATKVCTVIEREYNAYKKDRRYIDYDDMLELVANALA